MADYSFISNAHPEYIESLYQNFTNDPTSVSEDWRVFFSGFEFNLKSDVGEFVTSQNINLEKEFGIIQLISAYRSRGHLKSKTNPIKDRKERFPHLDISDYNLETSDLEKNFDAGQALGMGRTSLKNIVSRLEAIYCGHIGFEFNHIENWEKRNWLLNKIENRERLDDFGFSVEKKKRILEKLTDAVVFEEFLQTKFIGQKRFSLEGGENTITAIDAIINFGAKNEIDEVIIGMAHRGRLNILANILGKTYEQIFSEFEGIAVPDQSFGDGDVKYHLGFSSQVVTHSGKSVYLKLVPNPSHLEAVDPVVEGFSRAKADILYGSDYDKILPILIHGDAAAVGQGVVYETVQMSQLEGYYTGGTLHFVINNQVGFTTNFGDARSSTYSTAAASCIQAPVFHVNGDDPEAIVFAAELAVEYRQLYNNDVFIDMVCYRKHGHNEGDDPKFTQPEMYKLIESHPNPRILYLNQLLLKSDITKEESEQMEKRFWNKLQERLDLVKQKSLPYEYQEPEKAWKSLKCTVDPKDFEESPITGIKKEVFDKINQHLSTVPSNLNALPKINRLLKTKQELLKNNKYDWAMAELAAYGSVLLDGHDIRMSGQDVKRGTFSHRHAIFSDIKTYEEYNRLSDLGDEQGRFMIYNSLLSEFAVLGFEYGYSLANPNSLVLWEAQFGDFSNGAQTITDQFIIAGESKWQRMSGLVMLLPHGYEGQGPEHSSARLERFLIMCADFNITVANITTPSNLFHVLRRQLERPFRKPLVIMSPKSLLRHPQCISDGIEFINDTKFKEVIDDSFIKDVKKAKRLIFCSGKIYYELDSYRLENGIEDTAIVRIEQLYPFPGEQIQKNIEKYKNSKLIYIQEEPQNMGALWYIRPFLTPHTQYLSRKASSSPATGFKKVHDLQQENLIKQAFTS